LKATVSQAPKSCPNCGYPVVGDFKNCPNCGVSIGEAITAIQQPVEKNADQLELDIAEEVKCEKCGTMVSLDFSFCPKCGERIHLPTVRAIRHKPTPAPEPPKPKCHLTIIPEEGEITQAVRNDYEGDSIILNRENTEQDNRTITSKEQAELICEDGKWFVMNRSELGSTYLEANRKLALEPGDVIVLGDRRFKFETE
jgi:RNA polymerase subunit RPABC4/transcription elongation factor Spt4